eukprot:scaffold6502_cov66-Phaeocystis_antarctica.AAC.2
MSGVQLHANASAEAVPFCSRTALPSSRSASLALCLAAFGACTLTVGTLPATTVIVTLAVATSPSALDTLTLKSKVPGGTSPGSSVSKGTADGLGSEGQSESVSTGVQLHV